MAESSQYPNLFRPVTIRSMELKNRILMLPMHLRLDPRTEQGRKFYRARANGGAGAIISWATLVDLTFSDRIWGETGGAVRFMKALEPIVRDAHASGAKIGMQLAHFNCYPPVLPFSGSWLGPITGKEVCEWVAPSARVEPAGFVHGGAPPELPLRELTVQEIETIIGNFGKAAAAAKRAGFDFVEVHGAHGTLPCQFFSPLDNCRTDAYGGDIERRMRFGLDIVSAIRSAVGLDFPIFFRIPAKDLGTSGGITMRQSIVFAVELERAGVDCIDVSVGTSGVLPYWRGASPGHRRPAGTYVNLAGAIKDVVKVPVIAIGRIHKPRIAERVLSEGKADLVGMGRQLIAD
ncbi:MAG: NADH:flavin oxidoreductase, partial [Chloroflexi bacterium]|nr:NADH:flavin oxidoreductase [Chloroflexota bacterium]